MSYTDQQNTEALKSIAKSLAVLAEYFKHYMEKAYGVKD